MTNVRNQNVVVTVTVVNHVNASSVLIKIVIVDVIYTKCVTVESVIKNVVIVNVIEKEVQLDRPEILDQQVQLEAKD